MSGILKTCVLGKVTRVDDGVSKAGKVYFKASLSVSLYNFSTKKYDQRLVNIVGFERVCEAMKKLVKPGLFLYAEGDAKPGRPFKTNSGQEIVPLDLIVRDWCLAGAAVERAAQDVDDNANDEDEF